MAPKSVRSAVLARDPTALTPNTAGGGISSAHVGKFTKAVKRSRRIPSSSPSDSDDDDDTPAPRVLPPVAAAAAAAGSSTGPLVPISRPALLAKKKVELPAKDDAENVRKKLKTRLRAIALDGESEQDVLRRLHAEAEVVIDITNPFTKSHRDSCRRYWQAYVQEMQVPEVSWYFKDTFHTLGPAFIDMRARTTPGRYDKYIKAVTLEGIFLHFITVISMYCHDEDYNRCGVHQLSRFHLYEDLAVKVESLIRELELNRYRTEVVRWGRLEVQLVIEQALANTSKAGRMAALQTITILTIAFATAVRPGALMCSHPDYIKRKRYLTMRDLKISRAKATGSFSVVIDFCVMKGNASGARGDKLTFCLEPVTKAHNIIFEPSLYIVLFLFHRGALKVDSYEELLTGARTQVRIRDEFLARPMFCAVDQAGKLIEDSPAMTHTGSDAIARIAKNAGLSSGGGLYAIRRETGDNFGVRFGSVFAAKMLNHKVGSDPHIFRKHYSRDLANYPVVQLRLGEFDHTLDDVQRYRLDMYRLEQDAVLTILVRSRAPDARPTQRGSISAPAPVLTDVDKKAIDDGLQDCWRKIDVEYAHLLSLLIDRGNLLPATLPRKGNKPMWEKKLARSTFDPANEDAIAATTYRLDALYRDKNTQSRQLTKARDAASQKRTAAEAREQFLDQHDTRQDREAAATSLEDPSALYAKIFVETRRKPELAEGCVLPAFPIEGSQAEWEAYMIAAARIAAVRDDEYAPDSADIAHARQHLHVEVQRKLNDIPVFFNPAKGKKVKKGKAKKGKSKKGKKSKAKKGKSKKGKGKATDASDASEMEDEQPEETFEDLELFDDADEEDCLSTLDITRLRITLMDFVRLPILREQDERDRYLRDGKWCCDHPDCEYEFPQPKLLFRHLPTHAEWPVLQDSLPREPDRKYTCPAHDEPKFRNRSKQAVYEHMVSLDCVDRERHIDLLFDYREMLLAARGLKSIENALSATEALLVHANAILPSDVSPEWERTRREKAVMPAPEGPTGDDDDDDDEDEEVQEVPAPDPKEPSILSVLQTITPAHLHARAKELGRNPTPQQQRAVEDGWDAMLDALKTVEDGDDDAREVTDEEWAEFHIKMARAA